MSQDGSDGALPYYLARHIGLGFDFQDVEALIASIEASQRPQDPSLPHLPAEILFLVLEYIPVSHILSWRLICRGVRDYIDGPILYEYLRRAELIGYLGSHYESPLERLSEVQYDDMRFLRARYERLERPSKSEQSEDTRTTKWSGALALFQVGERWMQGYARFDEYLKASWSSRAPWQRLLDRLQLTSSEECYGTLRWCLRLDKAVFELDFPIDALQDSVVVDLVYGRILIRWKKLLFHFLKTETAFWKMKEDREKSAFTYGHEEDCLRAIRRQLLRSSLNMDDAAHRRIKWEMSLLRPLFGKSQFDRAAISVIDFGRTEDKALATLIFLRKEASMSNAELAYLQQLAADRRQIEEDLTLVNSTVAQWKSTLFDVTSVAYFDQDQLPRLPRNPVAWSVDERASEEARVKKWRTQRTALQQLSELLSGSLEAMSIPENAFDDLGSDFDRNEGTASVGNHPNA